MKKKQKQYQFNTLKFFLIICFMIGLIFLVTNSTKILKKPVNLFVVSNGSLSYEESVTGYILRDETVLRGENYKNGMVQIISDNQRAAKGEAVFRYYSNGEEKILEEIAKLDKEINSILENNGVTLFSSDVLSLEKQIENKIDDMCGLNDIQKIQESKKEIESYILKKAKITGETLKSDPYVASLNEKRNTLESELENGSEIIYSPTAGTVSYRVDGLEDILHVSDFDYLSSDLLNSFDLKIGSPIPSSIEEGKIVNNIKCYIALSMSSEKSSEAQINDKVLLRFSNSDEISGKIVYIKEENDDSRIIVFEITKDVENLIEYRKISFDVIWWKYSGLKISNSAIIEEDDKTYVEKNNAGYKDRVLIKVLRQNDTYSIVENYTDEELRELGYSDEEILDRDKIKLYDEILLH